MKDIKYNFNVKLSEDDHNIISELKEKYAINISQAFKLFLIDLLQKMRDVYEKEDG